MRRTVIADDHAVTRAGLRVLVEAIEGVRVVAEVGTGIDAIRACERTGADLVLMDVSMPEMDGIEATRYLAKDGIHVIMLAAREDQDLIDEAIGAGAAGWVPKSAPLDRIAHAIRSLDGHAARSPGGDPTPREREVLTLLARGHTAKRIGRELGISERTVNTHVGSLYRRLGVTSRAEAVLRAVRLGLIDPEG